MRPLSLLFTTFVLCLSVLHPTAADQRPNVVILLADDLGWADVGYHSNRVETPHIDALAAEGIQLDRFYVAPMCSPTRAGLMTGRYPIRFGLARAVIPPYRNFGLPTEERTLAEALGQAGYTHRGAFGKWHLGHLQPQWHPLAQGFTHFEGHYNGAIDYFTHDRDGERDWHINYEPSDKPGYSTDLIGDAAADFIAQHAGDPAPFFCYVPFNSPHSPFQAKPDDLERFASGKRVGNEKKLKAMIWSLDQAVGQILSAIDASGEADNTQVWFFSDNGGVGQIKGNNQPLRGNKLSTFEGGVRVPACVRWPAQWTGGRKVTSTVGYIDLLPTILTTAGVDPRARQTAGRALDGVSLHGLLRNDGIEFAERDWYSYHGQGGVDQETIAIKTDQWKLIVEGPALNQSGLNSRHQIHLFRIPDDLLEQHDLALQHPDVVQQLVDKLIAHRDLQPDDAVPPYDEGKKGFTPPKNWRLSPAD